MSMPVCVCVCVCVWRGGGGRMVNLALTQGTVFCHTREKGP